MDTFQKEKIGLNLLRSFFSIFFLVALYECRF